MNISNKFEKEQRNLVSDWVSVVQNKITNLDLAKDLILKIIPVKLEPEFSQLNGITGYCPSSKLIRIGLDFSYPKLDQITFALTLVHELHHAHREYMGIENCKATLKETMLEEGLADHYCEKILGQRPVWSINLPENEIKRLLALAKPDFNKPTTDKLYGKWFTKGSAKNNIPRWAGYTLGYYFSK